MTTSPDFLRLSPEDIDRVVANLRQRGGEHIARGRSGEGYAYRDGVFYSVAVDEFDHHERPFPSEAAFRAAIARVNFEDYTERYNQWALQSLGACPAHRADDPQALDRALQRQQGPALRTPLPWRGTPNLLLERDRHTFARLTPEDHPRPVWLDLTPPALTELRTAGHTPGSLLFKPLIVNAFIALDTPGPGHVALTCHGLATLNLSPP